jgi:MFS family permease
LKSRSFGSSRNLILFVLFLVGMLNYIDRTALLVFQEEIKRDLDLSDTQLGALTGFAFALVYTLSAFPIARLADRSNRKTIISVVLVIWSLMTALCGLASSFMLLVLCRMGVAMGEAGSTTASHSLISDLFKANERGRAISIWGLSAPIGTTFGFLLGGYFASLYGWRVAFVIMGIGSLFLLPIIWLCIREPGRRVDECRPSGSVPLTYAIKYLANSKTYRLLLAGFALQSYVTYVILTWNAPFYARVHGLTLGQLSTMLAIIYCLGGSCGIIAGGWLADSLGRKNYSRSVAAPAFASLVLIPFGLLQYFVSSTTLSLGCAFLTSLLGFVASAPVIAVTQTIVPSGMRGFTSAVNSLIGNLFGLGVGPVLTGFLSDVFRQNHHLAEYSLQYAIATSFILLPFASLMFFSASKALRLEFNENLDTAALGRR